MAFRATQTYWRSMLNGPRASRTFATTAGTLRPHDHHTKSRVALNAEFAPLYILFGMIMVATTIGVHTAKQHLVHSPAVKVNKKRRETVDEVDDPDAMVGYADKFVNKSFFRKVALVQNHDRVLPDSARVDPFTRSREIETLKTAGVRTNPN